MFTPVCHSVHREGCLVLGGSGPRGVPGPGGTWAGGVPGPRGVPGGDPPDGYCCGQYASYWNAFLLVNISQKVMNNLNFGSRPSPNPSLLSILEFKKKIVSGIKKDLKK